MPQRVQEAMQMQVEAERKKRAAILESEGVREAQINVAEGQRTARILASGKNHFSLKKCSNQFKKVCIINNLIIIINFRG